MVLVSVLGRTHKAVCVFFFILLLLLECNEYCINMAKNVWLGIYKTPNS